MVKKKIGVDDEVVKLFNMMLGVEDADPVLIEPKYESLHHAMSSFVKTWNIFFRSAIYRDIILPEFGGAAEFANFLEASEKFLATALIQPEENKIQLKFEGTIEENLYELGSKYNKAALNKAYRGLKESELLKMINITLSNLKTLLEDDRKKTGAIFSALDLPQALSNSFIKKTDLCTKILGWSSLSFREIYDTLHEREKEFDTLILVSLRLTYVNAAECYKIIMQPDIDIEKFFEAFGSKLDDVKVAIPGCDAAFKTLKKSLGLLKRNFGEYYKKFVTTSQNPGVIFESFLGDVANNNKNNPTVLVQFKKIIGYIKNNLPPHLKENPTVSKLWGVSEELFKNL